MLRMSLIVLSLVVALTAASGLASAAQVSADGGATVTVGVDETPPEAVYIKVVTPTGKVIIKEIKTNPAS